VTSIAWFALTTKSFGRVISEQKIFQVSSNQKQEFPWPCFSQEVIFPIIHCWHHYILLYYINKSLFLSSLLFESLVFWQSY
jgi:hypothetical protein